MARFDDSVRVSGTLVGGIYCVAALLFGLSTLDYLGSVWPFVPGEVGWRYGAVGIASNFILTPVIGLGLAAVTAAMARQPVALKVVGIAALVAAILFLLATVGFALDAVQVRRQSAEPAQRVVVLSATKAAIKLLAAVVAYAWLGVGALRQGQSQRTSGRAQDSTPLVMGS